MLCSFFHASPSLLKTPSSLSLLAPWPPGSEDRLRSRRVPPTARRSILRLSPSCTQPSSLWDQHSLSSSKTLEALLAPYAPVWSRHLRHGGLVCIRVVREDWLPCSKRHTVSDARSDDSHRHHRSHIPGDPAMVSVRGFIYTILTVGSQRYPLTTEDRRDLGSRVGRIGWLYRSNDPVQRGLLRLPRPVDLAGVSRLHGRCCYPPPAHPTTFRGQYLAKDSHRHLCSHRHRHLDTQSLHSPSKRGRLQRRRHALHPASRLRDRHPPPLPRRLCFLGSSHCQLSHPLVHQQHRRGEAGLRLRHPRWNTNGWDWRSNGVCLCFEGDVGRGKEASCRAGRWEQG